MDSLNVREVVVKNFKPIPGVEYFAIGVVDDDESDLQLLINMGAQVEILHETWNPKYLDYKEGHMLQAAYVTFPGDK